MAHFCVGECVCVVMSCVLSGGGFGLGGVSCWIGKALLCRMF